MLNLLDFFFTAFHTSLILFNLLGWIHPRIRIANLVSLMLTACSWFILGLFYGIGYCPLTDWHFRILEKLGETGLPESYITYLLKRLTGHDFNEAGIDILTMAGFIAALSISVYLNIVVPVIAKRR